MSLSTTVAQPKASTGKPCNKEGKKKRLWCTAPWTPSPQLAHKHTHSVTTRSPDHFLSPVSPTHRPFLLSWRGMKVASESSQLIADILWKWPCFFPSTTLSPHAAVVYRITPSPPDECLNRWVLSLCDTVLLLVLQCHSAGLSGWAAQELCGHAGADAGRKGLSGDWIPAGEGMLALPLHFTMAS